MAFQAGECGDKRIYVYLDVEGLPDRDFYHLIGARIKSGAAVQRYSLWAENVTQEKQIWNTFLSILAIVEQPVLVHYGSYERTFLKRMCERYGGPASDSITDRTLKSPLNLLSFLFSKIYLPTISRATIELFFQRTADSHEATEELLLKRILQSPAIHVDETKISILGVHQQVWGITNGREVVFHLTKTRETGFLQEILKGYPGVLVTDFYGGYDAITCRQQKCLVHLIRDLNDDLWKNPFNAEFEGFVATVRDLLVPIVEDIERFGLKAVHLRKHRKRVDCFYQDTIDLFSGRQEILSKYKKRFERYRDSMFTFLGEDGIPWNNNAAERALRHLAIQRKISGAFSEKGARRYLRLLAIAQTCRFQNKSFLGFLLSGLKNVEEYGGNRRRSSSSDEFLEID